MDQTNKTPEIEERLITGRYYPDGRRRYYGRSEQSTVIDRGRIRSRSRSRSRNPIINEINIHFPENNEVISSAESSLDEAGLERNIEAGPERQLERDLEGNPERKIEGNLERKLEGDPERKLEGDPENQAINEPGKVQFEYPEPQTHLGRFFHWCSTCLRVKKGFLSEKVLASRKLESSIEVDLQNLSMLKRNQIRRLKHLVQNNRAYSLFYYQRGLFWKRVYWLGNFIGLILTGGMTVINMIYDPCITNNRNIHNIIMGAAITTALAIITFMDASSRRRQYEEAGDEYKILAIDLYRSSFFSNIPFQDRDLNELIDEYSIRMEAYSKIYEEPPLGKILEILEYPEFDMNITFCQSLIKKDFCENA